MELDPKVLQKLLKEVPEMDVFRAFLAAEAFKLNTLDGLDNIPPADMPLEIMARRRAREVIEKMLGPLIETPQSHGRADPRDYMVEVEDIDKQK